MSDITRVSRRSRHFLVGVCTFLSVPFLLGSEAPAVTSPPESFFELVRDRDREVARNFYEKHIDVNGLPVVAAAEVADEALQRTYSIFTSMLAARPDINEAMADNGMYLIIMGTHQRYTNMPEYRNYPNHEFLHIIDSALRDIDPTWRERRDDAYRNAMENGLWKGAYASVNASEYWAETRPGTLPVGPGNNGLRRPGGLEIPARRKVS